MRMRCLCLMLVGVITIGQGFASAELTPLIGVERQPLQAATQRLVEALKGVGAPISDSDLKELTKLYELEADADVTQGIQAILDRYSLASVHINPESRVSVQEGNAKKELMQQGWRTFLVKVHNEAGVTARLQLSSPQALPVYLRGRGARQKWDESLTGIKPGDIKNRFLDLAVHERQPLKPRLSGFQLEYRLIQLYCRDAGPREATLQFDVGQGTQDLGFRSEVAILFQSLPAVEVVFDLNDERGFPTTAALVIRDEQQRVYPNPARRLAPDFFFHDQVYRASGESVLLPPGTFEVTVSRGPEYLPLKRVIEVSGDEPKQTESFRLIRWIHPREAGWYSGDHHVHAAGCKHYDSPTEGVTPADMMRHIVGEDLNVGCVLTWGPCWYYQKQYFKGSESTLSRPNYLMRYDIEVSGFPSSHAGHLCLLRLTEDDYPGTETLEEWPSWTLPVLQWGQEQGGVVGYSHSGWGLGLPDYLENGQRARPIPYPNRNPLPGRSADKLPDYAMPPFDGIGANEYIVTVTHDACDFISAVDTPAIWELNIWYHTLNCGFRTRISGETDFPCIYGDKVGLGRAYVKLLPGEKLTFDNWVQGIKDGRSYCNDGLSHIMDFKVDDVAVGEPGSDGEISVLKLDEPDDINVTFDVAALLEETPNATTEAIRRRRLDQKPYWHIERCRLGDSRKVPVELIVNGEVAETIEIEADGSLQPMELTTKIKQSSWVAIRILPSVHTNPVFVLVDNQPIRANVESAKWCRRAVDVCWDSKQRLIRDEEKDAARAAYEHARAVYERIIGESE